MTVDEKIDRATAELDRAKRLLERAEKDLTRVGLRLPRSWKLRGGIPRKEAK